MSLYASQAARRAAGLVLGAKGKVPVADLPSAGRVAAEIRSVDTIGERRQATPGEIYALSQIEEALQRLLASYIGSRDTEAIDRARSSVSEKIGDEESSRLLTLFARDFSLTKGVEPTLRELPVWMVIDENPAAVHATNFFFSGPFRSDEKLVQMLEALELGLATEDLESADHEKLLDLLRAPARAEPDSLAGQLRYILSRWGELLDLDRDALLRGLDLLAEEAKAASFGPGGGPVEAPTFSGLEGEEEQYSFDRDWMPSVVLLAKNVYVWLHQLSVSFDRTIDRLDQIPDEVLDEIARAGFTGLWLIGVWERSEASRRIKQMCGNPEAVASAYSVRAYRIADDLGGEGGLDNLRRRCAERGVRMAADMVPNHMGIDSDWVLDEPQRFLSTPFSPFPAYSFTGADFSPRSEIGIQVEDHYFDRTDAAVVFKRFDRSTGEDRFIYHGNDGTNMPWNDTAQLDYLNPETREAVIQTILEVARRFPIIRFDAAMTLARRHFQRLWFPAAGTGGAIPSRAEQGLSSERFAELMPAEFWREVVDRVAAEVPDTLLLAEAFWLMEGYFVRTLGMHRVYNSAFMHMVRDQENSKYKRLIKDTLAFDPRILNRYVNFLTNPDERTAVDQFGRDDRYFGACVLLATLPGLPMFGHGQLEGRAEKYGMEYRRSYHEEPVDEALVARHRHEIFPLLRRRRHFAGVDHFELYDFVEDNGEVNDNVFAYSNGEGEERSLVVFNNSFSTLRGRIERSAPRSTREGRSLASALGLGGEESQFWVLNDQISDSTFLRSAVTAASSGLHLELPGFGYRVFDDFRVVADDDRGRYRRLAERLGGSGVADLERAVADLDLEAATAALRELLRSPAFEQAAKDPREGLTRSRREDLGRVLRGIVDQLPDWARANSDVDIKTGLTGLHRLERLSELRPGSDTVVSTKALEEILSWSSSEVGVRATLLGIQILAALIAESCLDLELLERLGAIEALGKALVELGVDTKKARRGAAVASLALADGWTEKWPAPQGERAAAWVESWLEDGRSRDLIGFHHADGSDWVHKEDLEDLLKWRLAMALSVGRSTVETAQSASVVERWLDAVGTVKKIALAAGYRVDRMRSLAAEAQSVSTSADTAALSPQAKTASE